jgi:hypothetical protein
MNNLLRAIKVAGLLALAVPVTALGMPRSTADLLGPVHLLLFLIMGAAYVLPTALAIYRDSKSVVWIAVVNLFLGWTMFGWVAALGWAAGGKVRTYPPAIVPPTSHPAPGH